MAEAFAGLLEKAQFGDRIARDAVYKLAFNRLRVIAAALLRRERDGQSLQPTALVSELYLKLQKLETRVLDEDHFFRIAARAMRQVLIDRSRAQKPPALAPLDLIPELLLLSHRRSPSPENVLAAKMVFEKLQAMDTVVAETVWLRCVEGKTVAEMSRCQKREEWRVRADYDFGLQWMANRLKRQA